MFFEKDSLLFHIVDVWEIQQKDIRLYNSGRNINALSFRFRADTRLFTEDNQEYHLLDKAVCFVPAHLNYSRVAKEDHLIVVHFEAVDFAASKIEHFTPKNPETLEDLFSRIYQLWCEKDLGYRHQCAALFSQILGECYKETMASPPPSSKIQNAVDYLLAHYKNGNLTIGEIAERSFMSEVYFRRLFKKEYGTSPQKYITKLRIENAVGLISTGYYSLKEVAFLSGFLDYKYFSVEFKKAIGISPSAYAKHPLQLQAFLHQHTPHASK